MLQSLSLGERLALIRKTKKMTQEELANVLDLAVDTVESWESNATEPTLNRITTLAQCLNVSLNFLLEGVANTEQDKELLPNIEKSYALNKHSKELCSYVREIENLDSDFIESMFEITEKGILCNLQKVLEHNNFELFEALNKKYDFFEDSINPNAPEGSKKAVKRIIRKHPIQIEFKDIAMTNNLDFYKYALEVLDAKLEKAANPDPAQTPLGKAKAAIKKHTMFESLDRETVLCNALDAIEFNFEDSSTNEIILFLLENGAYIREYVPDLMSGGYQQKNEFMTSFIKMTVLNYKRLRDDFDCLIEAAFGEA